MSATVKGMRQLQARVFALQDTSRFLHEFAPTGIRHIKLETPHRTRHLSRNNEILSVSDDEIRFINRVKYALPVHEGSRPHDIRPKAGRKGRHGRPAALKFAVGANATLSGRPRSGAPVVFARKVRHPGNKPNRWMLRGIQKGLEAFGLAKAIIKVWDSAA